MLEVSVFYIKLYMTLTIRCTIICLIFIDQPELPDIPSLWTPWYLTSIVFLHLSFLDVSYWGYVDYGIHCPKILLLLLLLTISRDWLTTFCCAIINLLSYHYFLRLFFFFRCALIRTDTFRWQNILILLVWLFAWFAW